MVTRLRELAGATHFLVQIAVDFRQLLRGAHAPHHSSKCQASKVGGKRGAENVSRGQGDDGGASEITHACAGVILGPSTECLMGNAKQQVESLLHKLPDNCSLEDIQYHLYVLDKVRRGVDDARQQGAVSLEDAEKRLSPWLSE